MCDVKKMKIIASVSASLQLLSGAAGIFSFLYYGDSSQATHVFFTLMLSGLVLPLISLAAMAMFAHYQSLLVFILTISMSVITFVALFFGQHICDVIGINWASDCANIGFGLLLIAMIVNLVVYCRAFIHAQHSQ